MSRWDRVDPKKLEASLPADDVKEIREQASETVKLSRVIFRKRLHDGLVIVNYGPMPVPVLDEERDGKFMDPSKVPHCYLITWHGMPGASFPPAVNNNVLLRSEGQIRGQMWAMTEAAEVEEVLREAFGLRVTIPAQEVRS